MVTSSSFRMGIERTFNIVRIVAKTFVGDVQTHVVLLTELLGERSAHDDTALVRGSLEVSGTALATRRRDGYSESVKRTNITIA